MFALPNLIFLKLGGSLITDKDTPHTARLDVLARLAGEIGAALAEPSGLRLVLGHGSGSFGHVPARRYGTRLGVGTPEEWRGFAEVWREARALNEIVMAALAGAGLPAIAFPPSAAVISRDGQVAAWNLGPIHRALAAGLVPVVFGDVVFDEVRGGTILSTEDLFEYLARTLRPSRLLLAGIEPGVWADFPACTRLLERITAESFTDYAGGVGGSVSTDVTGGMRAKVQSALALALAAELPGVEVRIFSGAALGAVQAALLGKPVGTVIG
jgi:isopentenyl phosphate kinase